MSKLTILLPCSALVKQYLSNKYGNVIVFKNQSHIEKYFAMLVDKQPRKNDNRQIKYTESVVIWVDYDMHLRNGTLLTNTSIRDFNMFVEDQIYDLFITSCDVHGKLTNKKRYITEAIETFCQMNNFSEEHMSYDAAIKRYQRHRGINKFSKARQP